MTGSDLDLLKRYECDHAEDAFAEIVRRHLGLVYSAALRQVRFPQLAEEVAQSVFTDLARNAARLKSDTILTAWLYQVTRHTAIDVVRREARRQLREQIASEMNNMNAADLSRRNPMEADWTHIEPLLDEAMQALDDADRTAVLLRYFEKKSLREVGAALGTSDDAAQKRIGRAVERLREFFTKRGIAIGASGLVLVISANAVQAAPVGLVVTISTAAALGGTSIATATSTTQAIAMTTLQKTLVTATVAVLAGAGLYEVKQASQLRDQVHTFQQQQAELAEQTKQLQSERDYATHQLAALRDESDRMSRSTGELLRLRGEVTRLRAANGEASKTQDDSSEATLKSWLARANRLKQIVEQNADKKIPDLQLLSEHDWLGAARDAKLDTDKDIRQTLANLRHRAENMFAVSVSAALSKYMDANNRQFPTDLSQLQTYFDTPLDEAILQRWQIVPQSDLPNQRFGDWLITQKSPVDEELDQKWAIGPKGYGTTRYPSAETTSAMAILSPLVKAYAAANNGNEPTDPSQILPYLTTPEQQAAYQTLLKNSPTNNVTR